MQPSDAENFAALWGGAWEAVGRNLTSRAIEVAFFALAGYPLADVMRAVAGHMKGSRGAQPVTVADVEAQLAGGGESAGPGPAEAWALALGLADERDTAVVTVEILQAFEDGRCRDMLAAGLTYDASRAFAEIYARLLAGARLRGTPARWTISLGYDKAGRRQPIVEAIEAQRLSWADAARYGISPSPPPDERLALERLEAEASARGIEFLSKIKGMLLAQEAGG